MICDLLEDPTKQLVTWCDEVLMRSPSRFDAASALVPALGAHLHEDHARFGFWAPEISERRVLADDVFLEVFKPLTDLRLTAGRQHVTFSRERIPLAAHDEFLFGAVAGMTPGTREQLGDLYRVAYRDRTGHWHHLTDYLAHSLPFGAFAPAELYDMGRMQAQRTDRDYFKTLAQAAGPDGIVRIRAPGNILQVHVPTATAAGTLAGLAQLYRQIAAKRVAGHALAPDEETFVGYDAIQLMPIEPTIEYEAGPRFWVENASGSDSEVVDVEVRRPDMTNWGYDVVISGSAAVNPVLLDSDRPDELVDLIGTLHNFPEKPIAVIFDVVFGHADNQAVALCSRHFFAGRNMYGQDMNFRHPVVRAIMLEMQRRKVNFGADGLRVDGAQDFKWWDSATETLRHDDEYLEQMGAMVQEVAGTRYRPWMVFEDGRPWPREDWELASTYRAVIERQPGTVQWGPLTFAHNTPFLYSFWVGKWWRLREIATHGADWISGCANHDTLRRGTQVDLRRNINTRLGNTLLEILDNAYDNPAASLLAYGLLPGIPMEFINATMRASWGFIRNTDDLYGVKVVSEEAISINWQVDQAHFENAGNFRRLKQLGFDDLDELKRFLRILEAAVQVTEYDLAPIAELMNSVKPQLPGPQPLDIAALKRFAKAWMDDMHEYCNVSYYKEALNPERTAFNLALREFRSARPWLQANLVAGDHFEYLHPTAGSVLFYGLRNDPAGGEQLLFTANMEGAPVTIVPTALPIPDLAAHGWHLVMAAPGVSVANAGAETTLNDSQGFLMVRQR